MAFYAVWKYHRCSWFIRPLVNQIYLYKESLKSPEQREEERKLREEEDAKRIYNLRTHLAQLAALSNIVLNSYSRRLSIGSILFPKDTMDVEEPIKIGRKITTKYYNEITDDYDETEIYVNDNLAESGDNIG